MTYSVSLDVEEVLAATHDRYIEVYNSRGGKQLSPEDINYWDWVREIVEFSDFMKVVDVSWREQPLSINPMEEDLAEDVRSLSEICDVDVVTARLGVEEGMVEWLNHHGITDYNEYHSVHYGETKADMGYDIYIDDKPGLCEELSEGQIQFMIAKPYNRTHWLHPKVVLATNLQNAVRGIENLVYYNERLNCPQTPLQED